MFPFRKGDELFFNVSPNPQQQHKIPQDQNLGHAAVDGSNVTDNTGKSRRRKICGMDDDKIPGDNINNNKKKMMHRDIERQRRQEMATLCASLRSLLPLEFIKGKRSLSDQMHEAVNYIKHLEKKIKELGVQKDEIKRLSNLSTPAVVSQIGSSDNDISPCSIIVRKSVIGIEIVYSCGDCEAGLPLSGLMEILHDEGLCVVNCVSARVNERLLHTIQTEVNDPTSFNLSELQQKLTQVK